MKIDSGRVTDPETLSPREVADVCDKDGQLVVQFSKSEAYTPALLETLNEACRLVGERLQVRFYGHYGARFDAAFLRFLPETRNLAVDCLSWIDNEDEIGRLPKLKYLSFGVFELDRPDFLTTIDLGHLERLFLSENRKRNFDLSSLARCKSLDQLFINGHSKGIHAIEGLPRLRWLTLSAFAKKQRLDFIDAILPLKELTLILGGRDDIDDLSSKSVEILKIVRVRGLATMGDLSRFPALSTLHIEDQLRLTELGLNRANLERLWLINCKNLAALPGLDAQNQLREFRASRVALDLDALRDRNWPSTTQSVALYSGSNKWNDEARDILAKRNLAGEIDQWV
ncbi:hypothetical protein JJB09_04030 [Rhizobium sp. KVB221]|uniref:Leucine-rich repeat domain-containing protein n=1 Tax=Rhizobium setariae TaxID=2801340 RepID=A0A936YJ95_9HYPH|nr:hypothetical protein [Rhizobium setariae]MBL0371188.1 hypothetical protein [Rhizobium setariae]